MPYYVWHDGGCCDNKTDGFVASRLGDEVEIPEELLK